MLLQQIIILHNTKNPHNFYSVIFTELEKIISATFCSHLSSLSPSLASLGWLVYKLNISVSWWR